MNRRCRPGISRRSGCLTCKERHKKCDERKPRCENCTRLDLKCKQPDLFRITQPSRSRKKRASSRVDTAFHDANWIDSTLTEADERADAVVDDNDDMLLATWSTCDPESCFDPVPPEWSHHWSTPRASPMEFYLMQHYTEKSSSVLVNVDGPSNSLRSIILPRAVTSLMLMNALYATSAAHVSVSKARPDCRLAALSYYNKAATALNCAIADLGANKSVEFRELLLLTSVFLCKYEIVSGGLSNWRSHLRGLQKMFSIFRRNELPLSPEIVSFVQSFIAYHWYIAGITRTERLSLPSTVADAEKEMEKEIVLGDQIDPYMGVSGYYMLLLHSVAQWIMFDSAKESDPNTIIDKIVDMYEDDGLAQCFLTTLTRTRYHQATSTVPASTSFRLVDGLTPDQVVHLDHIANGYKNALIAYLHTLLEIVEAENTTDANILRCLQIRILLSQTKDEAVSACLEDIMHVPEASTSALGLGPLLFIIASETRDLHEFDIAFGRLTALWKKASVGNIGTTMELLRKIRQSNFPLDWRQALKSRKWDLIVS